MDVAQFKDILIAQGFSYLVGVPDSIFKDFLLAIEKDPAFKHPLSVNEGEACAMATGYHLATQRIPIVYLQNSGLGNSINPLTSLLDSQAYAIPALLFISWRGCPEEKPDEPQHRRMGASLTGLLTLLDIPYCIASRTPELLTQQIEGLKTQCLSRSAPTALIFKRDFFDATPKAPSTSSATPYAREQMLRELLLNAQANDIFIATTGKTGREVYEIRESLELPHHHDFLTVGSMGCAASIALGMALEKPQHRIVVLDGDGACLMRMGTLATIGFNKPKNFFHILVDNQAYESTGAQPTVSKTVDFAELALSCGYQHAFLAADSKALITAFNSSSQGPTMAVINVPPGSRKDLRRPTHTPAFYKADFMHHLGNPQ